MKLRRVGRPKTTNWAHIRLLVAMVMLTLLIAGVGYWSKVQANNQEEDRIRPLLLQIEQLKQIEASTSGEVKERDSKIRELEDKLEARAKLPTWEKNALAIIPLVEKYFPEDPTTFLAILRFEGGFNRYAKNY